MRSLMLVAAAVLAVGCGSKFPTLGAACQARGELRCGSEKGVDTVVMQCTSAWFDRVGGCAGSCADGDGHSVICDGKVRTAFAGPCATEGQTACQSDAALGFSAQLLTCTGGKWAATSQCNCGAVGEGVAGCL